MNERFSDHARHAFALANQEAVRHHHAEILPAHVLLGLMAEGSCVATEALRHLHISLDEIRTRTLALIGQGHAGPGVGKMPQSAGTRAVTEYAIEEARKLGHRLVGTEHLILGLLRYPDGVPAKVLTDMGVRLADLREKVLAMLHAEPQASVSEGSPVGNFEWIHQQELANAFHSPAFWHTLILATDSAHRLGHGEIQPEHLLLGVLRNPKLPITQKLAEKGVTADWLRQCVVEQNGK